jgi:CheY-like chemotaxis protein
VDTSLSGFDAIEQAKRQEYDIIFMDHMMPEMDGIEATAAIRAWENTINKEKRVPIIALTANAVSGMREMFIDKGFNDFLAKPIDVSKMDEALIRWIPAAKRELSSGQGAGGKNADGKEKKTERENLIIPGVDVQRGISLTGGTAASYKQVLAMFRKDAQDRMPVVQTRPEAGDMSSFVTQVHALKSASGSLGATEISSKAARLEAAGKIGDIKYIKANLDSFAQSLAELVINIGAALEADTADAAAEAARSGETAASIPVSVLTELEDALQSQNTPEIDRILEELMGQTFDRKTKEALERMSDDILMTEFDNAIATIEELRSNGN